MQQEDFQSKFVSKLKIKWYEWFPVLGTIAYSIRVAYGLVGPIIEHPENAQLVAFKKVVDHYRLIWTFISLVVAVAFLTTFFLIRDKNGFGAYPWPFWVGLAFGGVNNFLPIIPRYLFILGIKRWGNEKFRQAAISKAQVKINAKLEKYVLSDDKQNVDESNVSDSENQQKP